MRIADPRRFSRRRFLERAGYLGFGMLAWSACGGGDEHATTTLDATIVVDEDGDLVTGPGEPYVVRTELAQAQAGREGRRRSILAFHHLSDFRIVDEESPLRREWADECSPPLDVTSFRPQETLSVQAAAALIVAANAVSTSPLTRRPVDLAVHTGNATNNAHYNELRWFLDLMDGKPVYPDSGAIGYQGVQTQSPASAYDDLLDTAQRPFTPKGLAFPWLTVLGNRDILVEGNFVADERAERFAAGAQKLMRVGPDALDEACATDGAPGLLTATSIYNDPETVIRGVGSDGNRRVLAASDWMAEHYASAALPGPPGHGLPQPNVAEGKAYYVHEAGPVAFIVLDTVNRAGSADGSLDEAQFQWLEEQLALRSSGYFDEAGATISTANPDRLIVVVSHHPAERMLIPFADEGARLFVGEDLENMLHRFPNVLLHITGHTRQQTIKAKPDPGEGGRGVYWQVTTGGSIDLAMQGRLLEVVDNKDGTVSIFSTVYDSSAPLSPGDSKDPTPEDNLDQSLLAGIARQIAFDDPHADPAAGGLQPSDRNAELIVPAPFDLAVLPTPTAAAEPRD
jgi:metallophosphoesterase (TIGR03767 family)